MIGFELLYPSLDRLLSLHRTQCDRGISNLPEEQFQQSTAPEVWLA